MELESKGLGVTSLAAYTSVLYSRHKRLKRAAINLGLFPGLLAGIIVFCDLFFNLGLIDYSDLPGFIERYTYSILGSVILAAGAFGVIAVTGTVIGKSASYLYTLLKIDSSRKAKDIAGLEYEMNLCYAASGIQKRILQSITGCGKKAISYLVRWLTENRRPDLDRQTIEVLREFSRKYGLTEHLIQVASSKSKRQGVIEVLRIVADKEDGKALSFLHSLDDDQELGCEAKRAIEEIISNKA